MRADKNQSEIVAGLRDIGASVLILSQVGGGCPDLLVGFRGQNHLLEVKDAGYKLSWKQQNWFNIWQGQKAVVVYNLPEALKAIGAIS